MPLKAGQQGHKGQMHRHTQPQTHRRTAWHVIRVHMVNIVNLWSRNWKSLHTTAQVGINRYCTCAFFGSCCTRTTNELTENNVHRYRRIAHFHSLSECCL